MKKAIAILLALLMILGMAACKSKEKAEAAAPAGTENKSAAAAATPAPTAEPTATPAPTEVPAQVAVVNALAKLNDVKSMHMDMNMLMDMSMGVPAMGMTLPIKMTLEYQVDATNDPKMSKVVGHMAMDMGALGKEEQDALAYVDMTGEKAVSYSSTDGGATWNSGGEGLESITSGDSLDMVKQNAKEFTKVGADTVNGKAVTVYTGKLDGKYVQEVMASTGMDEMLDSMNMGDTSTEGVTLGDIQVTISVDDETGYPLYYAFDMTDLMKDVLAAAMQQAMGASGAGDIEINLDVSAVTVDCNLSEFDSVPAIEIPEAALAAVK